MDIYATRYTHARSSPHGDQQHRKGLSVAITIDEAVVDSPDTRGGRGSHVRLQPPSTHATPRPTYIAPGS